MPCESGPPTQYDRDMEELNLTTRLLCEVLTREEDAGRLPELSGELLSWWGRHKVKDKARRERAEKAAAEKAAKAAAVAKLTPEERKILGICEF